MARSQKAEVRSQKEESPAPVREQPVFVIRAGTVAAVRALMRALVELGIEDEKLVREFELACRL